MATIAAGNIGYIEIPKTIVKPTHYRMIGINTRIHSVVHTYLPELLETNNVHYQDMKQVNISFEVSHIDLCKHPILKNTVCNVQQSQKLALRAFPLYHAPKSTIPEEIWISILWS